MKTLISRTLVFASLLIYLSSCVASKHAGVASYPEPAKTHTDYQSWYLYYEDQLDAFKGTVAPPDDSYPTEARNGFVQAKKEWDMKVKQAKLSNLAIGLVGASTLVSLIIISSASY